MAAYPVGKHERTARMAGPATPGDKSVPDVVRGLWELAVAYARQETVDPLKNLGRYVGLGLAGAIGVGLGLSLLALSGLRALQTETGSWFTGSLDFVPYLVMIIVASFAIGLLLWQIKRASSLK